MQEIKETIKGIRSFGYIIETYGNYLKIAEPTENEDYQKVIFKTTNYNTETSKKHLKEMLESLNAIDSY